MILNENVFRLGFSCITPMLRAAYPAMAKVARSILENGRTLESDPDCMSIKEILEIILEEIKLRLEDGKDVKISGFGKWTVKEKRARPGRNPHTGERIEISARRVVTFHPSDKMRDSVNKTLPTPS